MSTTQLQHRAVPGTSSRQSAAPTTSGPTGGATSTRSMLRAVGRWPLIPIVLAVLGLAAGFVVGQQARPSAQTLVSVQSDALDSTSQDFAIKSARLALQTDAVFDAASSAAGTDAADLRARTTISQVPSTQVLSIAVTAASSAQAVKEADAVAAAGLSVAQARAADQISSTTDETERLIKGEKLDDRDAEQARVSQLGGSLGSQQSALLSDGRQLSVLQRAVATRLLPSAPLLALMGGAAGLLLGVAVAVVLGSRRGVVRSAQDLSADLRDDVVADERELVELLRLDARTVGEVFVGHVDGTGARAESVAAALSPALHEAGSDARVRTVSMTPAILRRVSSLPGAIAVVVVEAGRTRTAAVERLAAQTGNGTYILMASPSQHWD